MSAIDDDGTPLGQPAAPMIDLLGRATDRPGDDRIVGLESRAPPNVGNDRSQLCPEPDIKGLWRNRKKAFSIHDRALLALRAAQNLDGRPSDGASAVPRGRYIYYLGRPSASPDGQSWPGFFKAVLKFRTREVSLAEPEPRDNRRNKRRCPPWTTHQFFLTPAPARCARDKACR